MNTRAITLVVPLLFSAMLVLPPLTAFSAGRGQGSAGGGGVGGAGHASLDGHAGSGSHVGGSHGFGGGRGFGPQHSFRQPFVHSRPFPNHRFGRFVPFGAFVSPVPWYGWPGYGWPYFYGSALSSDPAAYRAPVAYSPAPAPASAAPAVYSVNIYNPAPAAAQPATQPAVYEPLSAVPIPSTPPPAPQGVVEYEGGRYELRGDGMTTAYRWVWIPNPPPGPPGASSMRAPESGELAPARRGTVYRWLDDQGALHMTDRWQSVPQRYREQAKQNLAS